MSLIKNKNPSPIQITAAHIIGEARQLNPPSQFGSPDNQITDSTELAEHAIIRCAQFEDLVSKPGSNLTSWLKYARFEESRNELDRARSIYERGLEPHCKNPNFWTNYIDFELRNKCVDHARNLCERAVFLLPRVDQLWFKYAHAEEMLGNVAGARRVFERWMVWHPDEQGWLSYIRFELRYNEVGLARDVYEKFVECHPKVGTWVRYANFELKNGEIERARSVYERARVLLTADDGVEELYVAFAEFEEKCKEIERARSIYKFALDHLPKERNVEVYDKFVAFEKRYGVKESVDDAIVARKRLKYESEIKKNPFDYDIWFDFIKLEESVGDKERVREVYERALVNVPPARKKPYWERYIYFWINYALYEELVAEDVERARDVYMKSLKLIPHKKFSFSKMWILAAQFEIRQLNLSGARRLLGNAIGQAPKVKIFKKYIELELQLGAIERCRKLYEKYLELFPVSCCAWTMYAELERSMSEADRARAIYELATARPTLDMPELLWKAYIDFEISEGEHGKARALYERLLDRSKDLKVWISYAMFEASGQEDGGSSDLPEGEAQDKLDEKKNTCVQRCRGVFERALSYYRESVPELKEERAKLLEKWLNMENDFGERGDMASILSKMPKKLKRRLQLMAKDGPSGHEEYFDYLFPEDMKTPNHKILEAAYEWKKQKA